MLTSIRNNGKEVGRSFLAPSNVRRHGEIIISSMHLVQVDNIGRSTTCPTDDEGRSSTCPTGFMPAGFGVVPSGSFGIGRGRSTRSEENLNRVRCRITHGFHRSRRLRLEEIDFPLGSTNLSAGPA